MWILSLNKENEKQMETAVVEINVDNNGYFLKHLLELDEKNRIKIITFIYVSSQQYMFLLLFEEGGLLVSWLVVLRLNVPVNNFSVMSGRSHRFLGN